MKGSRDIRALPGLGAITALFFAFLYLPLVILIAFSFNDSPSATVWSGFTLDWYPRVLANDDIQRAAVNSLIVASTATLCATLIATMAALTLVRGERVRHRTVLGTIVLVPLMVPEIVTAVATLTFFAAIGLRLGLGNIILAHIVFCIPFAYLPIRARLLGMDPALEIAARDLYASRAATLRHVTLPLLAPGIAAGAMLSFVVSIDDFIITLMVADAGSTTLPLYIFGLVRRGITPEVNALSTLLILASAAMVVLSWFLQRRA